MATVPAAVEPLTWLLGAWRGAGRGAYPTVDDFEYVEETTFACPGKPYVRYEQRTRLADGTPSHAETGYLRPRVDMEAVGAPMGFHLAARLRRAGTAD